MTYGPYARWTDTNVCIVLSLDPSPQDGNRNSGAPTSRAVEVHDALRPRRRQKSQWLRFWQTWPIDRDFPWFVSYAGPNRATGGFHYESVWDLSFKDQCTIIAQYSAHFPSGSSGIQRLMEQARYRPRESEQDRSRGMFFRLLSNVYSNLIT